jgi:hypothetical protein
LGDSHRRVGAQVFNPVLVDLNEKGIAGDPGQLLTLGITISNGRPNAIMSGEWRCEDQKGWLLGEMAGSYELGPGEDDSLTVQIQLPSGFAAAADSDSVTVRVTMTYDTGLPAESQAAQWVMVVGEDETSVPGGSAPAAEGLAGIYPNPFNPRALIRFQLASADRIDLTIYDAAGRRVRGLAQGRYEAGGHELIWDGRDDAGAAVPSGVYLVRFRTSNRADSEKAVLLR